MPPVKKAAPASKTFVEAKNVELEYSDDELSIARLAVENFGQYLASYVIDKYKEYYIAEVHIDDIRKGYLGWSMLKLDTSTHTVEPTKVLDEACRRHNLILAWKPMRRHLAEHAEWEKKQNRHNQFVAQESHKTQALEINQQLREVSGGLISATPLKDRESDE